MRRGLVTRLVVVCLVGILLTGAPMAFAETQTVDATLESSVSMSVAPDATVSGWTLASQGDNTTSGGNIEVQANVAYTVSVVGEKDFLTEWDGSSYGTTALATAMTIKPTLVSGDAAGSDAVVSTLGATLITALDGGTDNFSLILSQPTLVTDEPLATGWTYHNVITYTASETL